jgi:hypothetical protein
LGPSLPPGDAAQEITRGRLQLLDEACSNAEAMFGPPLAVDDLDDSRFLAREHDSHPLLGIQGFAVQESDSVSPDIGKVDSKPLTSARQTGKRLPVLQGDKLTLAAVAETRKPAVAAEEGRGRPLRCMFLVNCGRDACRASKACNLI